MSSLPSPTPNKSIVDHGIDPFPPQPHLASKAGAVDRLRRLLPRLEGAGTRALPFGIAAVDSALPQGGLALGGSHEFAPAGYGDIPAAVGFLAALLGRMPTDGPLVLALSPKGWSDFGGLHGHGLNTLGCNPKRIILVEPRTERETLWAVEESLRSRVPAAVAAAVGKSLDFKSSQRLQLAARASEVPLLLLTTAGVLEMSAAATRWRVGAARAARDRFGLVSRWRWRVSLERCRNGRTGQWLMEWDHATHRFSLATEMADPAVSARPAQSACG